MNLMWEKYNDGEAGQAHRLTKFSKCEFSLENVGFIAAANSASQFPWVTHWFLRSYLPNTQIQMTIVYELFFLKQKMVFLEKKTG